jgi:hypothetical protein
VVCGVPQDQINAAAAGSVLDMTGCSYSGTVTISKPLTLKGLTLNSPSGKAAVTVTASDVTLDHVTLQGPQATTFEWGAYGVNVVGSQASPVYRFQLLDSVITRYGYGGVMMDFAYDAQVLRNRVEDAVYAGIMVTSAKGGLVQGNTVRRIGVYGASANSNNAYGIAVSSNNPSVNPQSQDVVVDANLVEDVPTWHGLDTHAGIRITFTNNVVRGAWRGIFITGDGASRRNNGVTVSGNRIEAPATNDRWGIQWVFGDNGTAMKNNLIGWPYGTDVLQQSNTGLSISGNYSDPSAPLP